MSRQSRFLVAITLAASLSACATQSMERRSLDDLLASVEAAAADEASEDTEPDAGLSETPSTPDDASSTGQPTGVEGTPQPSPAASDQSPSPEATPTSTTHDEPPEQHSDFPMTASLDRDCVVPGGNVTIFIEAGENTGVGYHAVYAGGEGGADPPYGHGHGGNSGDLTDERGRYQDTWVVSPTAPIGPARVDVVAGRNGGFSTTVLNFEVADPTKGGCQ